MVLQKPYLYLHLRAIKAWIDEKRRFLQNIQKGGFMTQNQLRYWELQETKLSHRNTEAETNRSNLAKEKETKRANKAREFQNMIDSDRRFFIDKHNLEELQRSNHVREYQQQQSYNETVRTNKANEDIRRSQVANQSAEIAERSRSNRQQETLAKQQLIEQVRNNTTNNVITAGNLTETSRNNIFNNALAQSKLEEEIRANKQRENIQRAANQINSDRNRETARSNLARESLQKTQNDLTKRSQNISVFSTLLSEFNKSRQAKRKDETSLLTTLITTSKKGVLR